VRLISIYRLQRPNDNHRHHRRWLSGIVFDSDRTFKLTKERYSDVPQLPVPPLHFELPQQFF